METRPAPVDDLNQELHAVLNARRELAPEDEQYLVAHFLDRLNSEIDARIDAKLQTSRKVKTQNPIEVAAVVFVFAIPLSGIAAAAAGLTGLVVCWIAIALIVYLLFGDQRARR